MDRFERFMEVWGLLTMDWTRSSVWYVRWAGLLLGAVAFLLMGCVLALWWCTESAKWAWRWLFSKQ